MEQNKQNDILNSYFAMIKQVAKVDYLIFAQKSGDTFCFHTFGFSTEVDLSSSMEALIRQTSLDQSMHFSKEQYNSSINKLRCLASVPIYSFERIFLGIMYLAKFEYEVLSLSNLMIVENLSRFLGESLLGLSANKKDSLELVAMIKSSVHEVNNCLAISKGYIDVCKLKKPDEQSQYLDKLSDVIMRIKNSCQSLRLNAKNIVTRENWMSDSGLNATVKEIQ